MRNLINFGLVVLLAACGGPRASDERRPTERPAIAPQEFALIPCASGGNAEPRACKLLVAGGKYYLLGAPEGAMHTLRSEEIPLLDGVLLFSLLPHHIDGLDTVRHVSWSAGRSQPLLVAGPEGTAEFAEAFDSAFVLPDAELFAAESPAGGFDASLLGAVDVLAGAGAGTEVVDTGDLVIHGFYAPSGQIVYRAQYETNVLAIGMCGGEEDDAFLAEISAGGVLDPCNSGGAIRYISK